MLRALSATGGGDAAAAVAKCSSKRLWGWNERLLACDGSACRPWGASSSLLSSYSADQPVLHHGVMGFSH